MADDLSDITDDELVRRAASGDQSAWAALADRHLASVVSFAWYRLGDRVEAEDIAQETLLRFAKKALTWEPDGAKVRTWLYRVASNLVIDRQRAQAAFALRRHRRYVYHRYSAASRRETRCPPCGSQGTDRPPGPPAGRLNPCLLSGVYRKGGS